MKTIRLIGGGFVVVLVMTIPVWVASAKESASSKVELKSCPPAVHTTIQEKAGENKIVTITKSVKGKHVEYGVTVVRGKQERTFTVADDGEFGEWRSKHVEVKDCPPKVQKAIKEYATWATIDGIEDSVEEFVVDFTRDGQESRLFIAADGAVQSLVDTVALASCPAAVQETIRSKAARAKIKAVYRVTEGRTTKYTALIVARNKERECNVALDGQFLGWDDDDEAN